MVWNKSDRLTPEDADHLVQLGGFVVSALDRTTFGPLLLAIERELWREGKSARSMAPAATDELAAS